MNRNGIRKASFLGSSTLLAAGFLFSLCARAESIDPFSPQFRMPPPLSPMTKAIAEHIEFQAKIEPNRATRGDIVRLTIAGKLKTGFHTYPLTRRVEDQDQLSHLKVIADSGLKPLWPVRESSPEFLRNLLGKIDLEHEKTFTWEQDVLILPDTTPGSRKLDVRINLQVCSKDGCFGPDNYLPLEATIEVSEAPARPLTTEMKARMELAEPPVEIVAVPPGTTGEPNSGGALPDNLISPESTLLGLLGAAFGGAFLMLLTPCVFPMIPITVNFFLKQSEKEHHRPLAMASVYSGTIIVLLTLVMLVLGKVVVDLANNAWFNLALGAVLVFFALSLFGMYEIELPSGLARFTSAREGQGGYLGAGFMALTFTITSFTCTGPFLGAMMAPVAGLKPPLLHLVLAALVYSTTFAAPFFVLALFPTLMKKLPKSGSWLNAVKVTMGFLEVGAALKFLSNADISWSPGNPRFFNYDTVLCAWIALSVACGLYLFGLFRLSHDDKVESIGAGRMMLASFFIGLAIYMVPALWGIKPQGVVGENIVAFLPLKNAAEHESEGSRRTALSWYLDYAEAWKEAAARKKLIFIDFTGTVCSVCRANEENVFHKHRIQELLKKYVRVQLYTDSVPDPRLSKTDSKKLAERHAEWRNFLVANIANPSYVLFRPDTSDSLEDGKLKGTVIAVRRGLITSIDDFAGFLENALRAQDSQAQLQKHPTDG